MTTFLDLHVPGSPLLMPNPWDAGSARILATLGFRALATTSSGFAATLGRLDMSVTRDEALAHAATIVAAVASVEAPVPVPVSADLENCFADDPEGVAETIRLARAIGLAGCSVEDATGEDAHPIYERALAAERVAAAVEAAGPDFVITARAENFLHGRPDLDDTIGRLQDFQAAGAQVLFAPGASTPEQIRAILAAVQRPVNVLALADAPPVAELAELGVARISVGGSFAFAALGGLVAAARELLDDGTYSYWSRAKIGRTAAGDAFGG